MPITVKLTEAGKFDGTILYPSIATGATTLTGTPEEAGEIVQINGVYVVSLGKKEKLTNETLRRIGGSIAKWMARFQVNDCAVQLEPILKTGISPMPAVQALTEGLVLGNFKFDKYLATKKSTVLSVQLLATGVDAHSSLEGAVASASITAEAVNLARELSHEPPNVINPQTISDLAMQLATQHGLTFREIDSKELEKMGAGAIVAVGKGSLTPSRLIILEHNLKDGQKPVVLVGKTLTMDTGGYSLKGTENIITMKYDKTGGMVVLAAMVAVARLKLDTPVVGILAAAENMISSKAYRPDDILTAMNGKTIEIISTDAEGRLVLADALTYAERTYTPQALIDIATLTGAVSIALGDNRAGLLSNNDTLAQKLYESGEFTYERVWRLPLDTEYFEQIKGTDSDIKNSGGRKAGTIIGGMFLQQFISEDVPWAHLDIAGMMMAEKEMPYCPKGGMGFGVRLFLDYLKNIS